MYLTNSHREQVKSKKVLKYLKNCYFLIIYHLNKALSLTDHPFPGYE